MGIDLPGGKRHSVRSSPLGPYEGATLANNPQARKRARQAERRRVRNASLRSRVRTHIKKVVAAVDAGDRAAAVAALQAAVPVMDSMVGKGILHKNKAARHKSRLARKVNGLETTGSA